MEFLEGIRLLIARFYGLGGEQFYTEGTKFWDIHKYWPINLFREDADNSKSITIYPTGSHEMPNPKWLVDYPSFQVRVRGTQMAGGAGPLAMTQRIKNILLGVQSRDITGARLVSVTMAMDIMQLGISDNEAVIYVMNFNAIIEPLPESNPSTTRLPL